jgi:hypothetical protein
MPKTETMMTNSHGHINLTGPACKADAWFDHKTCLHTVVVQVVNFTGRIYLEASLEKNPTESDWFVLPSFANSGVIQFPVNPLIPTGHDLMGDTATLGFTFRTNALWLRARLDRTYLPNYNLDYDPSIIVGLGNVVKVTLAR